MSKVSGVEINFRILGLPGSLRAGSFNTGLLRAARDLAPAVVEVEIADISAIPLYNENLNRDGGSDVLRVLKERVSMADAPLFAAPEYNYSMTCVRKNRIDWLSRPIATSPLRHRPDTGSRQA